MQKNGFTLIELLITLSIMSIVLSIAAPSFQELIVNSQLSALNNNMVGSLFLARSEAIKRKTKIKVMPIDSNWSKGWQVIQELDDTVLQITEALPTGYTLTPTSGFSSSVTYQSTGRSTKAGHFCIRVNTVNSTREVIILNSGRIRSEKNSTNCS